MPRQGDEPVPGYRLERRLGRGSFGEVWSATGPGGTLAALKFISLSDKQGLREFRAIQRIKQIRHANLMGIIGIWLIDQHGNLLDDEFLTQWNSLAVSPVASPAGTMQIPKISTRRPVELIEAMPLGDQDLLRRLEDCQAAGHVGIPPDELMQYIEDAARAIDFLNTPRHDLGEGPVAIHHGDIKPQNIMLVGASAQVCDFGLARILGSLQATSTALSGSPAYMAPEIIRDKRPHPTTDQYALAIAYAELRTGVLPFFNDSYLEVMQAHLNGTLNLSALVNTEREVIQRATSIEPEMRFVSTIEMVHALRKAQRTPQPLDQLTEHEQYPQPFIALNSSKELDDRQSTTKCDFEMQPSAIAAADPDVLVSSALRSTPRQRTIGDTNRTPSRSAEPILQNEMKSSISIRKNNVSAIFIVSSLLLISLLLTGLRFRYSPAQPPTQPNSPQTIASSIKGPVKQDAIHTEYAGYDVANNPKQIDLPKIEPATPPPDRATPSIKVVSIEPTKPTKGETLNVLLQGQDPAGSQIRYQYRVRPSENWVDSTSGQIHFENLASGELAVEMRAINSQGRSSEIALRSWQIETPNHPPIVSIVSATEKLKQGDTLRVQLSWSDPDNDNVTFEWLEGDSQNWKRLTASQIEMTSVRKGPLSLRIRAVDAAGNYSQEIARTWSVAPKNPEPFNFADSQQERIKAFISQQAWADYLGQKVFITNTLKMQFSLVPPGEFMMGSTLSKKDLEGMGMEFYGSSNNDDERPQHRVQISKPLYVGTHEVTLSQFLQYYNADRANHLTDAEKDHKGGWGYDGQKFKQKPAYVAWNTGWNIPVESYMDHPVVNVSWNDAKNFCDWLSKKEGRVYRLLKEAEWEYACRAGTATVFQNGNTPDSLTLIGNIGDESLKQKFPWAIQTIASTDGFAFTAPVGRFKPNGFGLYDMHGNVWEWCWDTYDADAYQNRSRLAKDPFVNKTENGAFRVFRGGSWSDSPVSCRSTDRFAAASDDRYFFTGFRIALIP